MGEERLRGAAALGGDDDLRRFALEWPAHLVRLGKRGYLDGFGHPLFLDGGVPPDFNLAGADRIDDRVVFVGVGGRGAGGGVGIRSGVGLRVEVDAIVPNRIAGCAIDVSGAVGVADWRESRGEAGD